MSKYRGCEKYNAILLIFLIRFRPFIQYDRYSIIKCLLSNTDITTSYTSRLKEITKMKMENQLFYGDNLDVLRRHIKDESIDLCYIDPPFNSKRNYNQIYNNIGKEDQAQAQAFIDTWTWDDYAN